MLWYHFPWPAVFLLVSIPLAGADAADTVVFNRDIRPILSNHCFKCHGPDVNERQGGGSEGLRLDTRDGALADLGSGHGAIVPGKPDASELIRRIKSSDPGERMPPPGSNRTLSEREIGLLTKWVEQGAEYAVHWSYVVPVRPAIPPVANQAWTRNPIDAFILSRLEKEGLSPTGAADRYALIRRVSLDLTGLPPTVEEVDQFILDDSQDAYSQLVDRLLSRNSFGEHWARMWLDLARYADSAGYADDPTRTIWAYRDYVIRSWNTNKPFDQFTVEQIAGDLLPNPAEDQLIATAFHRNTLTNSEGGTNDEEFRNVAVVDRVNTTWSVWMGTSMTCAQCHHHKYDPISQEDYFRFFALLNNTHDADLRDESPLLEFYTDDQGRRRATLQSEIAQSTGILTTATPELLASLAKWEKEFPKNPSWQGLRPESVASQGQAEVLVKEDDSVVVPRGSKTDVYTVTIPNPARKFTALRLEALPDDALPGHGPGHSPNGNFVVSRVVAIVPPSDTARLLGRYLQIDIPGKQKILSLAEVQVFSGTENIALRGEAAQSTTDFDGPARLAVDGNTSGDYYEGKSVTHTAISDDPWWRVDLRTTQPIDRVVLWNRTDNETGKRLSGFRITVLDEMMNKVWEQEVKEPPVPSSEFSTRGARALKFASAFADVTQEGFDPAHVINNPDVKTKGWAIGGAGGKPASLTVIAAAPIEIAADSELIVTIEQLSQHEHHTLGRFRLSVTDDARIAEHVRTPRDILAILAIEAGQRSEEQQRRLTEYYLSEIAPELQPIREKIAALKKQLADIKPNTVPIMRELTGDKRRKTRVQLRGNFLDLGPEVSEGVPAIFAPLSNGAAETSRLEMARWLVDRSNPLTARVIANRFWEQIFGIGLVRTSEEFGAQGELPSHPELLDWLAVELMESQWNAKRFIKLLVTTAAYQQSSLVTPELYERDPENRLLARGPRFRLSAEAVRDQALFVSGLLSDKMYGPSVKPPQPALGLNAAFGSAIDWKTSDGSDRYRRGLYTEWRRSNPYPSMITFDAPNREVCTIRRNRTNTPLQALVTLNDPVYVECAQTLARRMARHGGTVEEKATFGFRICLARPPHEAELQRIVELFEQSRAVYVGSPEAAKEIATHPLGPAPSEVDTSELAAWTVVANVLLNLDEMFMKR